MPQAGIDVYSLAAIGIAVAIAAAITIVVWALRSGTAFAQPGMGVVLAAAIIVLAAVVWPLYPILLLLALPIAIVVFVVYFLGGRRRPL